MKKPRKPARSKPVRGSRLDDTFFWLSMSLLISVPLALSTSVYTKYTLPKFVVLLVGSSALLLMLAMIYFRTGAHPNPFRSSLTKIVCLYFIAVALSTLLGVSPVTSLFGSSFNYMGLITRICFFIFFISLIVAIGTSENRLRSSLWMVSATGFLVALYAVAQSLGFDPFVPKSTYTFPSPEGPVVRVSSSLGHSNYLGNFLLYTTPVSAGLALAARGWPRLFAIMTTLLSMAAITFSGTRGAWIGIIIGIGVFAFLELRSAAISSILTRNRRVFFGAVAISAALLISIIVISPASRSVIRRARSLMAEGPSGSGRALLWRDSLKMVPSFALTGCGPEGFRKVFPGFKSRELAALSPKSNNESSHNSFLDAAISYGLPGAALYGAIIALALALLIRARRRARAPDQRIIITSLLSSIAAALVHNIFIFDQIATGFYFFAFVALAEAASNIFGEKTDLAQDSARAKPSGASEIPTSWTSRAVLTSACLCVGAALWYSAGLIRSDAAYKELFNPANPIDYNGLVRLGERITSSPLPTGAYDYLFARGVDIFISKLPSASTTSEQTRPTTSEINRVRIEALKLAITHVERSLAHTITPELNYSLLSTLAMASGDVNRSRDAAGEAVKWDPNNYRTRWLMAEALLARGEKQQAAREAEFALELYPVSMEAASALARARGANNSTASDSAALDINVQARNNRVTPKRSVEELIEAARAISQAGNLQKARIKLMTAITRAEGPCPVCHRELALVYEKMGRYPDAIAEWETVIGQATQNEPVEQVRARIETLKQKSNAKQ
ncbi:MAG: O-antigen ligase family protein [Blastocatellia bacterium]